MRVAKGKWWDFYLLHYPKGSYLPWHRDDLGPSICHYRVNLVVKKARKGGQFYYGHGSTVFLDLGRLVFFRPDVSDHCLKEIEEGSRWVLSLGWARPL